MVPDASQSFLDRFAGGSESVRHDVHHSKDVAHAEDDPENDEDQVREIIFLGSKRTPNMKFKIGLEIYWTQHSDHNT